MFWSQAYFILYSQARRLIDYTDETVVLVVGANFSFSGLTGKAKNEPVHAFFNFACANWVKRAMLIEKNIIFLV